MKRNAYLERQKAAEQVHKDAAAQTYAQYMAEMFALALNDPEVMGKDTLLHSVPCRRRTITGKSWTNGSGRSTGRGSSRSMSGTTGCGV